MDILGTPSITADRAATWAASRGAPPWWCDLAHLVWNLDGIVRPEVIWAQAAKETGFGKFGGVIDQTFRNPCGMKVHADRTAMWPDGNIYPDRSSNLNPNAHHRFTTWGHGFLAQHDHLALYAGAAGYPLRNTPDPRHFSWLLGRAPTVEQLSNNWAGAGYGESLVEHYLNPLLDWG